MACGEGDREFLRKAVVVGVAPAFRAKALQQHTVRQAQDV